MIINSYFANLGVPATGLSPTIRVWEVTNASHTLVVTDAAMVEIGDGFYKYVFVSYDPTKDYVFRSDGGMTLSAGDRYSVGATDTAQIEDATIADIVTGVWDQAVDAPRPAGSFGEMVTQIKADTTSVVIGQSAANVLINTLLKYERNRTRIDTTARTLTIYDDDGTTPLTVFDLKDHLGNPSIVEVCERMPV